MAAHKLARQIVGTITHLLYSDTTLGELLAVEQALEKEDAGALFALLKNLMSDKNQAEFEAEMMLKTLRDPRQLLRQTGRTTRMVEAAAKLASGYHTVYVLMNSNAEARSLRDRFRRKIPENVRFLSKRELPDFDVGTLSFKRPRNDCVVFVDHHVLEDHHAYLLDHYFRY